MAHFLEGLDGLESPVAGGGLALAETDAWTLVTDLADRLRLDDAQLQRLAEKLAQEYVDRIADREFPVEHVVIVGRDPVTVGRHSFTSMSTVSARGYEVLVDHAHADEALRLATRSPHNTPGAS